MSYVCCMRQTRGIGYKWNTSHCAASLLKLSLVPRSRVGGKSGLVSTVCACVVLSGGAPTPAGTSVFTKHNWDIWEWGICGLMGGAFIT